MRNIVSFPSFLKQINSSELIFLIEYTCFSSCVAPTDRFPRLEKQKMPLQLGHGRGKKYMVGFHKIEKRAKKNAGDLFRTTRRFVNKDLLY